MSDLGEKVKASIKRLKAFEPKNGEGYYLAFSGGKDSVVCKHLLEMAGVKYDATYRVTSVDPPELVWFIQKKYPDVEFNYPRYSDGTVCTMWNLIPRKQMPPTRYGRYCCEHFKESNGQGRITVTGVRWAESQKRTANQGVAVFYGKPKTTQKIADEMGAEYRVNNFGNVVLNDDNDEARRMVEHCYRTQKTMVNPIIDWEDEDVWEFLNGNGIEHCILYDQGYKRLGCIGCPMNSETAKHDLEKYPVFKRNYIKAFERMRKNNIDRGVPMQEKWKDGESIMKWWLMEDE